MPCVPSCMVPGPNFSLSSSITFEDQNLVQQTYYQDFCLRHQSTCYLLDQIRKPTMPPSAFKSLNGKILESNLGLVLTYYLKLSGSSVCIAFSNLFMFSPWYTILSILTFGLSINM